MKTLLISGKTAPPAALREIIERGSTAVHDQRAADTDLERTFQEDPDRIVFWHTAGEADVTALAAACAARDPGHRSDMLVFVTHHVEGAPSGLSSHQLFLWPRDEDRLQMAFMTGA